MFSVQLFLHAVNGCCPVHRFFGNINTREKFGACRPQKNAAARSGAFQGGAPTIYSHLDRFNLGIDNENRREKCQHAPNNERLNDVIG